MVHALFIITAMTMVLMGVRATNAPLRLSHTTVLLPTNTARTDPFHIYVTSGTVSSWETENDVGELRTQTSPREVVIFPSPTAGQHSLRAYDSLSASVLITLHHRPIASLEARGTCGDLRVEDTCHIECHAFDSEGRLFTPWQGSGISLDLMARGVLEGVSSQTVRALRAGDAQALCGVQLSDGTMIQSKPLVLQVHDRLRVSLEGQQGDGGTLRLCRGSCQNLRVERRVLVPAPSWVNLADESITVISYDESILTVVKQSNTKDAVSVCAHRDGRTEIILKTETQQVIGRVPLFIENVHGVELAGTPLQKTGSATTGPIPIYVEQNTHLQWQPRFTGASGKEVKCPLTIVTSGTAPKDRTLIDSVSVIHLQLATIEVRTLPYNTRSVTPPEGYPVVLSVGGLQWPISVLVLSTIHLTNTRDRNRLVLALSSAEHLREYEVPLVGGSGKYRISDIPLSCTSILGAGSAPNRVVALSQEEGECEMQVFDGAAASISTIINVAVRKVVKIRPPPSCVSLDSAATFCAEVITLEGNKKELIDFWHPEDFTLSEVSPTTAEVQAHFVPSGVEATYRVHSCTNFTVSREVYPIMINTTVHIDLLGGPMPCGQAGVLMGLKSVLLEDTRVGSKSFLSVDGVDLSCHSVGRVAMYFEQMLSLKNGTKLVFATQELRVFCAEPTGMDFTIPLKLNVNESINVIPKYRSIIDTLSMELLNFTDDVDNDFPLEVGCENETVAIFSLHKGATIFPKFAGATWCWLRSRGLHATQHVIVREALSLVLSDELLFPSHIDGFNTMVEVRAGSGRYEFEWSWGTVPTKNAPLPKVSAAHDNSGLLIQCPSKILMPAATLSITARDTASDITAKVALRISDLGKLQLRCGGVVNDITMATCPMALDEVGRTLSILASSCDGDPAFFPPSQFTAMRIGTHVSGSAAYVVYHAATGQLSVEPVELGHVTVYITAHSARGEVIRSEPLTIDVYPPVVLRPRCAVVALGSMLRLSLTGGPGATSHFVRESQHIIQSNAAVPILDMEYEGMIKARHAGSAEVAVTYSLFHERHTLSATITVREVESIELHVAHRDRLFQGTQFVATAVLVGTNRTLMSPCVLPSCGSLRWTFRGAADAVDASDDDSATRLLFARTTGEALLNVSVTLPNERVLSAVTRVNIMTPLSSHVLSQTQSSGPHGASSTGASGRGSSHKLCPTVMGLGQHYEFRIRNPSAVTHIEMSDTQVLTLEAGAASVHLIARGEGVAAVQISTESRSCFGEFHPEGVCCKVRVVSQKRVGIVLGKRPLPTELLSVYDEIRPVPVQRVYLREASVEYLEEQNIARVTHEVIFVGADGDVIRMHVPESPSMVVEVTLRRTPSTSETAQRLTLILAKALNLTTQEVVLARLVYAPSVNMSSHSSAIAFLHIFGTPSPQRVEEILRSQGDVTNASSPRTPPPLVERIEQVPPQVMCGEHGRVVSLDGHQHGTNGVQCVYDIPLDSLPTLRVHEVSFQGISASTVVEVAALPLTAWGILRAVFRWFLYIMAGAMAGAFLLRQYFLAKRREEERAAAISAARTPPVTEQRRWNIPPVAPSTYYR